MSGRSSCKGILNSLDTATHDVGGNLHLPVLICDAKPGVLPKNFASSFVGIFFNMPRV